MDNVDTSYRRVIIENISSEVTEDGLIEKFKQMGNVTKFIMIRDPDLSKNKVIAYCEYSHSTMALNAFKILNGANILGQQLKIALVPEAAEINNITESITTETNDSASEVISQAVSSLPPDQMYELMKQMKLCIQNNPNEARNMLLQNPQLAYALLQAQIVMKIADPKVAIAMLNRSSEQIPQMSVRVNDPLQTEVQLHGRNVSMFPKTTSVDTMCSIPGDARLDRRQGLSALSRYLTVSNTEITGNTSAIAEASRFDLLPQLGQKSDDPRLQKERCMDVEESLDQQDKIAKATLIAQVLNLSDHQIAMLPEDQRRSILVLKEQLRK